MTTNKAAAQDPVVTSEDGTRTVVVMKWGTLYSADYVNVLFHACKRNINGTFRFVCLTDDPDGINPGVTCVPIPDIGLSHDDYFTRGVWPKLALFVPELYGITGRVLFIDLDMIIVGSLDPFFAYGSGVVCTDMGEGWRRGYPAADPEVGTCMFSYGAGQESQILKRFQDNPKSVMAQFRNEQDFVGSSASSVEFWPQGWVISFKRFLRQPVGLDLFFAPRVPPPDARVVAFHGRPRPIDLVRLNAGFWDVFPHLGHGQVQWIKDYWLENGGHLPK